MAVWSPSAQPESPDVLYNIDDHYVNHFCHDWAWPWILIQPYLFSCSYSNNILTANWLNLGNTSISSVETWNAPHVWINLHIMPWYDRSLPLTKLSLSLVSRFHLFPNLECYLLLVNWSSLKIYLLIKCLLTGVMGSWPLSTRWTFSIDRRSNPIWVSAAPPAVCAVSLSQGQSKFSTGNTRRIQGNLRDIAHLCQVQVDLRLVLVYIKTCGRQMPRLQSFY